MTAALSVFYPLVTLACANVPLPVMDDAIRRAARQFCEDSHAIVDELPLVTAATQATYTPALNAQTELVAIEDMRRPPVGTTLTPIYLVERDIEWITRQSVNNNTPANFAVVESYPLTVALYPTPVLIETLTANFVTKPTKTATVVDDRLADWYLEAVLAYAKYWLKSMDGVPWADAGGAQFEYTRYGSKVTDVIIVRSQARVDKPGRIQMRPFA